MITHRTFSDSEFKEVMDLISRGGRYDFADEIRGCGNEIRGAGEGLESCRADGLGEFKKESEGVAKAAQGIGSSLLEGASQVGVV